MSCDGRKYKWTFCFQVFWWCCFVLRQCFTMQPWMSWNLLMQTISACLHLQNSGTKGIHHHTQLIQILIRGNSPKTGRIELTIGKNAPFTPVYNALTYELFSDEYHPDKSNSSQAMYLPVTPASCPLSSTKAHSIYFESYGEDVDNLCLSFCFIAMRNHYDQGN